MGQVRPQESQQNESSSLNLEKCETSVAIALNRISPMAAYYTEFSGLKIAAMHTTGAGPD